MSALDYARRFQAAGFVLIPLGKAGPALKRAIVPWSAEDPDQAAALRYVEAGHNYGVKIPDGAAVVDIDPRNFEPGTNPIGELNGALPATFTVMTGGGGRHLYYRIPQGTRVAGSLARGVDVKGPGTMVVGPGSKHPDGGTYIPTGDPGSISAASRKFLDLASIDPGAGGDDEYGTRTPQEIGQLLDQLDPCGLSYDEWFGLLCAAHHATAGEAVEEFVAWSTSDPRYAGDAAKIRAHWSSVRRSDGNVARLGTLTRAVLVAGGSIPWDTPGEDFEPLPVSKGPPPSLPASSFGKASMLLGEIWPDQTLVQVNGDFLHYVGTHWEALDRASMEALIHRQLEGRRVQYDKADGAGGWTIKTKPYRAKQWDVADIRQTLSGLVRLDAEEPSWLDGRFGPDPRYLVPCQNGILDVETRELLPHTSRYFSRFALDFAYDPNAPEPVEFLRFLRSLWPEDGDCIVALLEYMGLCLVQDTSFQKMLFIVGPKRSGKGTLARLQRDLVGPRNFCGPTLNSLTSEFGLQQLIGKSLGIIPDARIALKGAQQQVIVERLLSVSGEDYISVNRKNAEYWHGQLPTRLVVISNELPRLGDISGALASRFIVLPMTRSFYGQEDRRLSEKLRAELPGILNLCLDALQCLRARGHFVQPKAGARKLLELERLSSPLRAFLDERCDLGPDHSVAKTTFFQAFHAYVGELGMPTYTEPRIGRDLKTTAPEIVCTRPRVDGAPVPHFSGVRLRYPAPSAGSDFNAYRGGDPVPAELADEVYREDEER